MPGMTVTAGIETTLAMGDIVTAVLKHQIAVSNLYNLCIPVDVPNLTGTVPVSLGDLGVAEDLEELEPSDIQGSSFSPVAFNLKKDRVYLAASDESQYRSRAGNPLDIQIQDAGQALAQILDKKVIKALETSPQTTSASSKWDTITNSIFTDLAKGIAGVRPYRADFVIMPSPVYQAYMANNTIKDLATGAPEPVIAGALARIPGHGIDIFVDDGGFMTEKSILVGASKACAAYGRGPVKVNTERDNKLGADVYIMDVFRQVVAPVFKNSSNFNKAVYQVTGIIS